MRRFLVLARSAALEALAEPLSAVVFLVALLTIHWAPVFHYHQFGEAGRLARECGFSALLVFGLVFATAAAMRVIGGEIASGTAAVALARPVPRPLFFCAKVSGMVGAFLLFSLAVAAATVLATYASVEGAARLAACCEEGGAPSRIWQPGLRLGTCLTLGGFVLAALANRFASARFCVTACVCVALAQPLALASALPFGPEGAGAMVAALPWRIVPALGVLTCGCTVFIVLAGALAVRLKPAPTVALVSAAVLSSFAWPVTGVLPVLGRFWLVEALAAGQGSAWCGVGRTLLAAVCLVAFWLLVGSVLLQERELP